MRYQTGAALIAISAVLMVFPGEAGAGDGCVPAQICTDPQPAGIAQTGKEVQSAAGRTPIIAIPFQIPCEMRPAARLDAVLYDYVATPVAKLIADPIGALAVGIRLAAYEFSLVVWAGSAPTERQAGHIDAGPCLAPLFQEV